MVFIKDNKWADELHDLLFKSTIVPDDIQFINDRVEGKAIAVDIIESNKNEILYFKKGKQAAKMVSLFTGYKTTLSRDKFLMKTACPAIIIKSNSINVNNIAEALLEL